MRNGERKRARGLRVLRGAVHDLVHEPIAADDDQCVVHEASVRVISTACLLAVGCVWGGVSIILILATATV